MIVSYGQARDMVETNCHGGGRRALQALPFLENALQGGYRQAYLELYKAHALLAREYKANVPSSNET
jgi:hypothetical protein